MTYFLNYEQTKEARTKILGLKVFANIVEEARGPNSNFKIFFCSPLVWLARRALLKSSKNNARRYFLRLSLLC